MSRSDEGHYAQKHGPGAVPDPEIRDALLGLTAEGRLPCALAFEVAKRLGASPAAIGRTADLMELRLTECQLGLFDYPPRKGVLKDRTSVSPGLEEAIRRGLVNDYLPCDRAWQISKAQGIQKMEVSAACDALGIKIKPCQLGAF
jgi:hypothetical protein